jgi:putative hemolysin
LQELDLGLAVLQFALRLLPLQALLALTHLMDQTQTRPTFRLTPAHSILRPVARSVERVLALSELERRYTALPPARDALQFVSSALQELGVTVQTDAREVERLPTTGAAIVCANHPYGAVEGLILARELCRIRKDVKILVNSLLDHIVEMRELFLVVDVFASDAQAANARALRGAMEHLRRGGMLAIFPAGEVSSLKVRQRRVMDPRWSESIARMALRTGAQTCPAYFEGRNSSLFQLAGLVHPRLRTALLPRELLNKQGRTIEVRFGTPIAASELSSLPDDRTRTDYLRLRTYALGDRTRVASQKLLRRLTMQRTRPPANLAAPVKIELVRRDIEALPPSNLLAKQGSFEVRLARAEQIPHALLEVGRLREQTFRTVGEGTGRARDLDRFDARYLHLILWDTQQHRIAGAYRLGGTDELVRGSDAETLYTATLFHYDEKSLRSLSPALELGRSFVALDYQRSYAPLLLLWKGIGAYLVANPRYRRLFGPVSISASYHPLSRQLMAQYLQKHRPLLGMGKVAARTEFALQKMQGLSPQRVGELIGGSIDLSALVSDLEHDKKGVPVLLREYLKLGGRLLALNVDPDFNDALDALLVVDLLQADEKLLERYLGVEGLRSYRAYHQPLVHAQA